MVRSLYSLAVQLTFLHRVAIACANPTVTWYSVDLRPSLSPYGQTQVHTPNIQKLADNATVFLRAYCQEAVRDNYAHAVSRSLPFCISIRCLMVIRVSAERVGLLSEPKQLSQYVHLFIPNCFQERSAAKY